MSWDIYVGQSYGDRNYTYNVGGMLHAAGFEWRKMHRRRVGYVASRIEATLRRMEADPDKFREYNPSNGWGDYEGCLAFLRDVLRFCRDAIEDDPTTRVYVR